MKCQKEIFLLRGGRQNAILWAAGIPTPEQSTCLDGRLPSSVVEELSTGTALTYRYDIVGRATTVPMLFAKRPCFVIYLDLRTWLRITVGSLWFTHKIAHM